MGKSFSHRAVSTLIDFSLVGCCWSLLTVFDAFGQVLQCPIGLLDVE
jgi:hypothetical protein